MTNLTVNTAYRAARQQQVDGQPARFSLAELVQSRLSANQQTAQDRTSLDASMKQWVEQYMFSQVMSDMLQKTLFPDPDDPTSIPALDGNSSW